MEKKIKQAQITIIFDIDIFYLFTFVHELDYKNGVCDFNK